MLTFHSQTSTVNLYQKIKLQI